MVSPQGATPWKSAMGMNARTGMEQNGVDQIGQGCTGTGGGTADPFLVGPEDTAAIANWDGSLSSANHAVYSSGADDLGLGNELDVSMGLHPVGSDARYGLGFDYMDSGLTNTYSTSTMATPSKYPSTLGSGYVPSSRRPGMSRLVSGSMLGRSSNGGPILSVQPASSPLPGTIMGQNTPSSGSGSGIGGSMLGMAGPASRRMQQQMSQASMATADSTSTTSMPFPVPTRTVSSSTTATTYSGLSPRPGMVMSRSASTSSVTSAFTSRPLARMGSFRHVSSTGTGIPEGNEVVPVSPHMFPTPNMSEGPSPAFAYQFQPYMRAHNRQVSALSGSTLDTPALDSSMPSPEFSTHHHSPLATPLVGISSAGLVAPQNYFQAPLQGDYHQFQQKLTGLAIQVDDRDSMWNSGPLSGVTSVSMTDTLHSAHPTMGHDHSSVSTALPMMDGDATGSSTSPVMAQMGQMQSAQAAALQMFQLTGQFTTTPVLNYDLSPVPPTMEMMPSSQPSLSQSQWSYQTPIEFAPVPHTARSGMVLQSRHVSSPYDVYNTGQQLQLQPPLPLPRSVSAGYIPVMNTGLGQDLYPRDEATYSVGASLEATIQGGGAAAYQSRRGSSMGLMSAVLEGGNDRAAKRQRVKYPPVGKRLRPGPKPKPKTPKSARGDRAALGVASSQEPLPYDPFVEIAKKESIEPVRTPEPFVDMQVETEQCKPDTPLREKDSRRSETPAEMTAVTLPPGSANASQAGDTQMTGEAQSNVTRTYLEKCYVMFMQVDNEAGGPPVKRYRCNIDDCERVFPRKSAIHSHIQTHLEDKPFVCTEPDW